MIRIIIVSSIIIFFGACAYHDVVEYKDNDGKKENRINLSDNIYVEFDYISCNKSYYEEENPKYYLSSRCSIWSENEIEIELINFNVKIKTEENEFIKLDIFSVGNGEQKKNYVSFNDFLKEKQIRFGWDIYMPYDYEYIKYKLIILEYNIVIKENDKLLELKGEKNLHRNMRRVRTYPWLGV